ncbi:unnamed protein product [Prunus brigantina]
MPPLYVGAFGKPGVPLLMTIIVLASPLQTWWPDWRAGISLNFLQLARLRKVASSGVVLRNHDGEVVGGKANLFQALSADQAEGQALLDGLSLAKDNGFLKLSFFHAIKDLRASFESLQWSWEASQVKRALCAEA